MIGGVGYYILKAARLIHMHMIYVAATVPAAEEEEEEEEEEKQRKTNVLCLNVSKNEGT